MYMFVPGCVDLKKKRYRRSSIVDEVLGISRGIVKVKGFLAVGIDDDSPAPFTSRNAVAHGTKIQDLYHESDLVK